MKIFDCFMFYDEELLLDIRLNILDQYVDFFVIVESEYFHNGNKRQLKFDINKFKKFNKKIIYINKSLNNFQKESYNLKRSKIIKHRLFLRKKKRNFHWYILRLNINSFIQIINSIINFYLYKKKYLMFIKNL